MYAEYIHVSMRYLLICADNPVLDDQSHYKENLRTYAETYMCLCTCANNQALGDK